MIGPFAWYFGKYFGPCNCFGEKSEMNLDSLWEPKKPAFFSNGKNVFWYECSFYTVLFGTKHLLIVRFFGNNLQKKIESTHFVSRAFRDFAQKRQWIHVNNAQCISFFVEHFAATFVCIIHKNCEFVHKINCDWWVGKSTNNSRLHHGIFSALKHWNLRQTWFEFHNFCEIFLLFPPIFF